MPVMLPRFTGAVPTRRVALAAQRRGPSNPGAGHWMARKLASKRSLSAGTSHGETSSRSESSSRSS